MTFHVHSANKSDHPFLAPHSCSQQSFPFEPTQTIRRRPSTFSAIAAWAAHVQPGSPACLSSCCSLPRRPSLRRGRRPSVTSTRVRSASFHIPSTSTLSDQDFKADLTAVGYTSVFLQLPISATLSSLKPVSPNAAENDPISSPTSKPHRFARFRSFSVRKSKFVRPGSPTRMKAKATAASAGKRKKAKYPMRPPPLASEIALMQFLDGGSTDSNIKRFMEAEAKATGAVGLADVYRDGDCGIWVDQDEELEYTHLLAEARATGDPQWVTFNDNMACTRDERRGSVLTQESDVDLGYIAQHVDPLYSNDLALFDSAVMPLVTPKPNMSVLSIPSRPHRAAKHLQKPEFLVDAAFSHLHGSPESPQYPISSGAGIKNKGKYRRRPAPLELSPPSLAFRRQTNSPIDPDKARQEFIDSSFEPVTAVSAPTQVDVRTRRDGNSRAINGPWQTVNDHSISLGTKNKPSVLNVLARFRSKT